MYAAYNLSPIIPSYQLRTTVRFLQDIFGFDMHRDDDNYVILTKNNTMMHLCRAGEDIGEMAIYLAIEGVDELWASIQSQLQDVKVKPPFNQDYGMREFHLIIPHTKTLMFVGEPVKP